MSEIRVAIAGIYGKMGELAAQTVQAQQDMKLVAGVVRSVREGDASYPLYTDMSQCIRDQHPDVFVDLTHANAARTNIEIAVQSGVRPVIGTTGLSAAFLSDVHRRLLEQGVGGLYAPNFAIGALLMMKMSELAARYLSAVEIIEYHHAQKKDAPSGTARRTAQRIALVRAEAATASPARTEHPLSDTGAHATLVDGVPIHSVRLPGFVAHQEVIFGGYEERLTIRHDSMSRASFMPGILLGIRQVLRCTGLVEGLEHFLF